MAVSGRVRVPEEVGKEQLTLPAPSSVEEESKWHELQQADIYKDLRLRGYDYTGVFRGIKQADNHGKILPSSLL